MIGHFDASLEVMEKGLPTSLVRKCMDLNKLGYTHKSIGLTLRVTSK
jgi:hypothetical protein